MLVPCSQVHKSLLRLNGRHGDWLCKHCQQLQAADEMGIISKGNHKDNVELLRFPPVVSFSFISKGNRCGHQRENLESEGTACDRATLPK